MSRSAPRMPGTLARSAFELFTERGFGEVTIDQIAARAGVTKGSFYSHFKSKHEVILAACSHYYRTYQQKVHAELARSSDPLQRLRSILELSVRTCVMDRGGRVFTTEIFTLSQQDEELRNGWAQFYDSVRETYVGLVLAAKASGQLDSTDPRRAVDLMLATIEGIKLRAGFEPHVADTSEQRNLVDELQGILASR